MVIIACPDVNDYGDRIEEIGSQTGKLHYYHEQSHIEAIQVYHSGEKNILPLRYLQLPF
jgi:hypothetical protein